MVCFEVFKCSYDWDGRQRNDYSEQILQLKIQYKTYLL